MGHGRDESNVCGDGDVPIKNWRGSNVDWGIEKSLSVNPMQSEGMKG